MIGISCTLVSNLVAYLSISMTIVMTIGYDCSHYLNDNPRLIDLREQYEVGATCNVTGITNCKGDASKSLIRTRSDDDVKSDCIKSLRE